MRGRLLSVVLSLAILALSAVAAPAQNKRVNVSFKPGTSGGTYSNSLTGYATVDFYLKARAGQNLSVKLNSANTFLYLVVLQGSGDGEAVADAARDVTEWSGPLPADGGYVVRVYLVRAEARRNKRPVNFKVRLDITP